MFDKKKQATILISNWKTRSLMVFNKGMQDFLIPALKMWALTLAQAQCRFSPCSKYNTCNVALWISCFRTSKTKLIETCVVIWQFKPSVTAYKQQNVANLLCSVTHTQYRNKRNDKRGKCNLPQCLVYWFDLLYLQASKIQGNLNVSS